MLSDFGGGTFVMPGATELDWTESAMWDADFCVAGNGGSGPMNEVRDTAAELLGYEPYSMENMDGFGCGGCHVGL